MTGFAARIALVCAALLPGSMAVAEAPPAPMAGPATTALDPERLAVARQIVGIALPPGQFSGIFRVYVEAVTSAARAKISSQLGYGDPGLGAIVSDFLDKFPRQLQDVVTPLLPDLAEAMARAYARAFTREELVQILAFGQTPAGAKYLSRSTTLMQDADMQSFVAKLLSTAQKGQGPLLAEFRRKYTDYLNTHPQLLKKISRDEGK